MSIDLGLFSALFITQFVGHRIGDYLLQTNVQALQKTTNENALIRHCLTYSVAIFWLMLMMFGWKFAVITFLFTLAEHLFIDTRKPVIWWKNFIERDVARNKDFKVEDLPFFVMIEVDQSIHLLRIFLISLLLAQPFMIIWTL